AHAAVGPETLAKILFTSGSTSDPKGVLTTHGMMCANQAQMAAAMPFLAARPPRIMDWLPWNHVFGGSHNVNMMLCHGGSLYIDDGKPTKTGFAASLRNLREHPGTLSFNVPVGFSMLIAAMQDDPGLRRAYFGDLDLIFYAGASLPQDVWEKLERYALEEKGSLPLMASSWGMTETAPATIMVHEPIGRSGVVGVPLPGTTVKLIPDAEMRCELRVKGPNVMPGYYGDPVKTAEAFDAEGFLITGDALRFLDPADAARGLVFDGRVSEDFKLMTGTWVQAGALRLEALRVLAGLVQDLVICGHDRGEVGVLIFPAPGRARGDQAEGALTDPALLAEVRERLTVLARQATGSARRIARALVLAEPPQLAAHEVTDKGSLNIRKILTRRAALVERLYDNEDPALVRV
ncbi:MAG TPA: AMP-binding protein, partial [Paracoccaceae bacterium]